MARSLASPPIHGGPACPVPSQADRGAVITPSIDGRERGRGREGERREKEGGRQGESCHHSFHRREGERERGERERGREGEGERDRAAITPSIDGACGGQQTTPSWVSESGALGARGSRHVCPSQDDEGAAITSRIDGASMIDGRPSQDRRPSESRCQAH
jgi:hypothetical protein